MEPIELSIPETIARHLERTTAHPLLREALSGSVRKARGRGYRRVMRVPAATGHTLRATLASELVAIESGEMSATAQGFRTNSLRRALVGLDADLP